jgi:TorA maturation chaperone TorD
MLLNRKSNSTYLKRKFQLYSVLNSYYNSELWEKQKWAGVGYVVKEFLKVKYSSRLHEGLALLENITEEDITKASCEFNRLFVGPGKLLAPPYESSYRNPNGLLMQEETFKVREFYKKAGLAVAEANNQPDDHLALELELGCYLLMEWLKSIKALSQMDSYYYERLYHEFLQNHLQQWIFTHCDDVIKSSNTNICRGMALILKGLMELEQDELKTQDLVGI